MSDIDIYGYSGGSGGANIWGWLFLGTLGFLVYLFFKERDLRKYIVLIFASIILVSASWKYLSAARNDGESLTWFLIIVGVIWGSVSIARKMFHSDSNKSGTSAQDAEHQITQMQKAKNSESQKHSQLSIPQKKSTKFAHRPLPSETTPTVRNRYRKAIDGDPEAQFLLGLNYELGDGVEDHYIEAAGWYKESAEHGHPNAQFRLALLLKAGLGVRRDLSLATKYALLASNSDHQFSDTEREQLADLFGQDLAAISTVDSSDRHELLIDRPESKQSDIAEAQSNTQSIPNKSAQANAEDLFKRGVALETGRHGITANYRDAAQYYLAAAEKGHKKAQFNLSLMYRKGLGVEQDEEEADKWLKISNT